MNLWNNHIHVHLLHQWTIVFHVNWYAFVNYFWVNESFIKGHCIKELIETSTCFFGPKQRIKVTGYAIHLNTILCSEIFYILHVFLFYLPSFLLAKFKPDLLPTLMVSHMFVKEKNCRVTSLTLLIGWNNSVYSIVFTVLCFNDIHWQCWLHWYRYNMYLQLQFTAFTSQ